MNDQNIFALSSGFGKAGVSVIRISGSGALKSLKEFGVKKTPRARVASLRKLFHPETNDLIDEALIIYFEAPNSFTGENIVEIQCHGSQAVVSLILSYLSKISDFRVAEAGEFSKRAFDNGILDLLQAEGLADLIDSETELQAKQATKIMQGEVSKIYDNWRNEIIEIMAFIEAYVDFPDEDIPNNLDLQACEKIKKLKQEIDISLKNNKAEKLREGANVAIIGKPNVGKSSLINYLSNRDVAIVSNIAGTTRDSLESHINIKGYPINLIDTAGIRSSNDVIEIEGVKRALKKAQESDLNIIILDASEEIKFDESIDQKMIENSLVVANKIDLNKKAKNSKFLEGNQINFISLKENSGLKEFENILVKKLETIMGKSENHLISRTRHRQNLQDTSISLDKFLMTRKEKLPIELSAEALRQAAFSLGKITGKIGVEDILDKIFSEFCIGK